jgi:hypothetical protein
MRENRTLKVLKRSPGRPVSITEGKEVQPLFSDEELKKFREDTKKDALARALASILSPCSSLTVGWELHLPLVTLSAVLLAWAG